MSFLIYVLISFIVFFFTWKKVEKSFKDKITEKQVGEGSYKRRQSGDTWVETSEFWILLVMTSLWWIAIPCYIIWNLLELAYNKFK